MSDLISRQAAIDALDEIRHALWEIDIPSPTVPEYIEHHEQIQSVWKLLDKKQKELYVLPPAQPEQPWIPCSERLPEYFDPVITWDGYCYSVEKRIPCIRDEDGDPIKGEWWVSDDYDEDTDYYPNLRDGAAIAWMPLPEPYKGDDK